MHLTMFTTCLKQLHSKVIQLQQDLQAGHLSHHPTISLNDSTVMKDR